MVLGECTRELVRFTFISMGVWQVCKWVLDHGNANERLIPVWIATTSMNAREFPTREQIKSSSLSILRHDIRDWTERRDPLGVNLAVRLRVMLQSSLLAN